MQNERQKLVKELAKEYAKGMSTRDIEDHIKDIYGVDISANTVSKITDKIIPLIAEWQSRPLERVYPIVYLSIHCAVLSAKEVLLNLYPRVKTNVLKPWRSNFKR